MGLSFCEGRERYTIDDWDEGCELWEILSGKTEEGMLEPMSKKAGKEVWNR